MAVSKNVRFTFRSAGAFFWLSALSEITSPTSGVPLFGAVHSGAVAVIYHLVYTAMFAVVGVGLWAGKPWGDKAVLAVTAFYTLDQFQSLLNPATMAAAFYQGLGDYAALLPATPRTIMPIMVDVTWVVLACWWAFAWYAYRWRGYFRQEGR